MLSQFETIAEACDLSVAPELHRRIGVVGAGAITQVAHLPAYRRAGVPVAGICDLDADRAEHVRKEFDLERTYTFEELLADDSVEVLDIAVFPEAQPALVRRALDAGKHVLAQKPLAVDSTIGAELVAAASDAGRALVVNHQMRYGEGMAAARAMVAAGWVGEVTAVTFDVDIATDFTAWDWLVASERLDLMYHSIHYFDSVRALLGTPETVYCAAGRRPGQAVTGETRTMTTMTFADGVRALVKVNHENRTGDQRAEFRIDGSAGSIRGTVGLLYDYPHGRPDTLEVNSSVLPTDGWLPYPVSTRWIPDAFAGPIRALLIEASGGPTAPTTAPDGLQTLRLVESAYASIATNQVITL